MESLMKNVWKAEQEILDVVKTICDENHLRYSLAYGTLLGAVRHKGFIPWDDDIDIMMPREDYEKLCEIWDKQAPQGYILENENNTEDLPINHMKVRKDHTTFLQDESERSKKYHKGIFIDIFPGDRRAPGKISQIFQFADFALYLLYNRGYPSKKNGLMSLPERLLLSIPQKYYRPVSRYFGKRSRRWNCNDTEYIFPATISECRVYFPSDIFKQIVSLEFNGNYYSVSKKYDAILQIWYGDYMKLPPEEERIWTHHPLLIDFERNFNEIYPEEYLKKQL